MEAIFADIKLSQVVSTVFYSFLGLGLFIVCFFVMEKLTHFSIHKEIIDEHNRRYSALATLLRAQTSLEFFFSWELMTVSSYLLITLGRNGVKPSLIYLLFSLGSAFLILAGFAVAYAASGSIELSALGDSGALTGVVFALLAAGFAIKLGAFGAHGLRRMLEGTADGVQRRPCGFHLRGNLLT